MDKLVIRIATLKDFDSILAIWLNYYGDSLCAGGLEEAKDYLTTQLIQQDMNYVFWVATLPEDGVIGWSSMFFLHPHPSRVKGLFAENSTYVAKEYRHMQVGKKLLSNALAYCKQTSIEFVQGFIDAKNVVSINMCLQLGFKEYARFSKKNEEAIFVLLFYSL